MTVATQKTRLHIGLIGGGFMGKAHSNAYHSIPYIFHPEDYVPYLATLSAATEDEAAAAADRYGFSSATSNYMQVVTDPAIDVIDVCTSDSTHKEIAMAALRNGKHVLCEKPLATNLPDALDLAREEKVSLKTSMCGFNYRFTPAVRLAKALIERGVIGKIYCFHGMYNQDNGAPEDTPYERLSYAYGPKSSGVAYQIGTHVIDMARFLIGGIESVMGEIRTCNKQRKSAHGMVAVDADEEMLAIVDFEGGIRGTIRSSVVASGRKNQHAWEINGSKGSLAFDMEDANFLSVYLEDGLIPEVNGFTRINVTQMAKGHPFAEYWWPQGHGLGWEHAHVNEIAHFLDCAANGKPVAPYGATFEDGYRAILTVEAIRVSSRQGRKVYLSEIDTLR